jgi:hypothetical protein
VIKHFIEVHFLSLLHEFAYYFNHVLSTVYVGFEDLGLCDSSAIAFAFCGTNQLPVEHVFLCLA